MFIDADMRLPRTALEHIRAIIRTHNPDFITPAFKSDGRHWVDSIGIRTVNRTNKRIITRQHKVAGIGGVMVVRAGVHTATGGFPEQVKQDDVGYVARLNALHATAYYAREIVVTNSSRRLREEGVAVWLLGVLPANTPTTRLLGRILRTDPSVRQYGHYTDKSR